MQEENICGTVMSVKHCHSNSAFWCTQRSLEMIKVRLRWDLEGATHQLLWGRNKTRNKGRANEITAHMNKKLN